MVYFGDKLRELRTERNMTQEELANKLDIVKATVSGYETSQTYPSVEVLIKLCDIFDVSADYLLGRSESRTLLKSEMTDEQLFIVQRLIREFERSNQ